MSSKFVVAQTSGLYEFSPAYQKVYEADGPTAAAIAHHVSVVEEARRKHDEQVQRYEDAKKPAKPAASKGGKKPAPRATKQSRLRDPGPFVEPKPGTVIVLDVERNEWHSVSVQPPPPPPYEEWVWTVKEYTEAEDLGEDEDDEF